MGVSLAQRLGATHVHTGILYNNLTSSDGFERFGDHAYQMKRDGIYELVEDLFGPTHDGITNNEVRDLGLNSIADGLPDGSRESFRGLMD